MCTYDFTKCSLSCSFNAGGGSGWSQEEKTWKKPHLWINHHLEIQQFLSFDFITSNSFPVYHNLSFRGRELLKVQPRKRSVSPPPSLQEPKASQPDPPPTSRTHRLERSLCHPEISPLSQYTVLPNSLNSLNLKTPSITASARSKTWKMRAEEAPLPGLGFLFSIIIIIIIILIITIIKNPGSLWWWIRRDFLPGWPLPPFLVPTPHSYTKDSVLPATRGPAPGQAIRRHLRSGGAAPQFYPQGDGAEARAEGARRRAWQGLCRNLKADLTSTYHCLSSSPVLGLRGPSGEASCTQDVLPGAGGGVGVFHSQSVIRSQFVLRLATRRLSTIAQACCTEDKNQCSWFSCVIPVTRRRLQAMNCTLRTLLICPVYTPTSSPEEPSAGVLQYVFLMSQTRTELSMDAEAIRLLSGLKVRLVMLSVWPLSSL